MKEYYVLLLEPAGNFAHEGMLQTKDRALALKKYCDSLYTGGASALFIRNTDISYDDWYLGLVRISDDYYDTDKETLWKHYEKYHG